MKKRVSLLAGIFLLFAGLGLGLAQTTVVLNSTYVPWDDPVDGPGWVRVWSQGSSKFVQDDAIIGRSLVRFDIRYIPRTATITSATLHYYRQKSISRNPPEYMKIYHVTDDSWDPDVTIPPDLYRWPTTGETPISTETGTEGWNAVGVTSWLQEELLDASDFFSLKFQESNDEVIYERIASPTAWYSKHRPYVVVNYTDPIVLGPDLTVNRHDIKFNTMWPVPYDPVTITATVHNVGGSATSTWFDVRFYDNGQWINNQDVRIYDPIPGGGGTAQAQITWYPTEGVHDIEVIADPGNPGQIIEIREDNNSNLQNHDPYKFEVRGQYKYYVESFETENPLGWWGRYRKDADLKWDSQTGEEPWDITQVNTPPPPYEGSYFLNIWMDAGLFDDGSAWVERSVPDLPPFYVPP